MRERRFPSYPSGFNPTQNQSEGSAPVRSQCGGVYRAAGVALSRGFQTYLPGPFHFEDETGETAGAPYIPAPVVQFIPSFRGEVSLREAPILKLPEPWRRKAP